MHLDTAQRADERRPRGKQLAIMFEPVHTNFEPAFLQLGDQYWINRVVLGHEVERRAKPIALIQISNLARERVPVCPLDVMREHERESRTVRPKWAGFCAHAISQRIQKTNKAIFNGPLQWE